MLKHTETESEPVSAAKVRVTPEELAAALARLEARQEAGRHHVDGTVEIGEVVQELGLNVTAEEVLREVQQLHAKPKRNRDYRALACAIGCLFLPMLGGLAKYHLFHKSPDAGLTQAEIADRYFRMKIDPYTLVQASTKEGPITETLAEVPDGQLFQCDLHGANHFSGIGDYPTTSWTFLKHQRKVYICGWTQRSSTKALLQNGVTMYRQSSDLPGGVKISLPLDGFIHANPNETEENPEKIEADVAALDKLAWEKW